MTFPASEGRYVSHDEVHSSFVKGSKNEDGFDNYVNFVMLWAQNEAHV